MSDEIEGFQILGCKLLERMVERRRAHFHDPVADALGEIADCAAETANELKKQREAIERAERDEIHREHEPRRRSEIPPAAPSPPPAKRFDTIPPRGGIND